VIGCKKRKNTTNYTNFIRVLLTQQCRSEIEKFILQDLLTSVQSKLKKYHPSGTLKFKNSGIS